MTADDLEHVKVAVAALTAAAESLERVCYRPGLAVPMTAHPVTPAYLAIVEQAAALRALEVDR